MGDQPSKMISEKNTSLTKLQQQIHKKFKAKKQVKPLALDDSFFQNHGSSDTSTSLTSEDQNSQPANSISEETKKNKKTKDIAVAGSSSLITTGAGVTLMIVGGPIGMVAGGIILGAGISGTVSTTQQALNKNQEEFDYKRWGVQTGIGAAGGVIAAPISFVGSAIAGTGTGIIASSAAAKAGVIVTADVAGSMAAGAGTKMLANAYDGKEISEGVLQQAVISGVTGGIAVSAGLGVNSLLKGASDAVEKVIIHTTAGVLVSGTTGGLGCLLHNIINQRKIDQDELSHYLKECGASMEIIDQIWLELNKKDYIVNNEFTQKCEKGIFLGHSDQETEIQKYQGVVNAIYQLTKDVWKDVWESAAESAAVGGVLSGVVSSTCANLKKPGKTVNKAVKSFLIPKSHKLLKQQHKHEASDLAILHSDNEDDEKNNPTLLEEDLAHKDHQVPNSLQIRRSPSLDAPHNQHQSLEHETENDDYANATDIDDQEHQLLIDIRKSLIDTYIKQHRSLQKRQMEDHRRV